VDLPLRPDGHPSPRQLLALLEAHVGTARAAQLCADLLDDDPHEHAGLVVFLGGHAGRSILDDGTSWKPYWARVWGARGLLYVWDDRVIPAVLSGLRDDVWRVAEGCLRVCALHELPGGDDAAALTVHELPRVRAAALRSLGAAGDVEHAAVVEAGLDDESEEVRRSAARALDQMRLRLDLP